MEPRELLKALMARDGDNPNSLAAKLLQKTKQPQIYKYIEGVAKEPRRSTLRPIAEHYGFSVEAFYDPRLAEQIYRSIFEPDTTQVTPPSLDSPVVAVRVESRARATLAQLAEGLSGYLLGKDLTTRRLAMDTLRKLADDPDRHVQIAAGMAAILDSENRKVA